MTKREIKAWIARFIEEWRDHRRSCGLSTLPESPNLSIEEGAIDLLMRINAEL